MIVAKNGVLNKVKLKLKFNIGFSSVMTYVPLPWQHQEICAVPMATQINIKGFVYLWKF